MHFQADGVEFIASVIDFHTPVDAPLGLVN
jgi:hypothetical protein